MNTLRESGGARTPAIGPASATVKRRGYDAALPVTAAWALEFTPVNVSVVFMQRAGNEYVCIGSRSWMFEAIGDCVAEIRTGFPWRVAEHVLPPEREPRVWQEIFGDMRVFNVEYAPELDDRARMVITQRMLPSLYIDTAPRPWEEGRQNNEMLIESLNGYRMKELASHSDVFTLNVLSTHEQYLTRALEHYAAWARLEPARPWGPRPDYTEADRGII